MGINLVPTVIYSAMLGMTVFALFDVANTPRQKQSLYLAGLLTLLLIHILGELFIYSGAYKYAPALAGAQFPIRVLLGPALYFYAFAAMSPEKNLPKKAYLLALLGPVIVILGMLPFIFGISPEQKLALANPATRDPELFKIALATCLFAMLAFIAFTAIYLVTTFRLQSRHRLQLMERFSDIEKRSMDWFRRVLILWAVVWLLFTLEYGITFMGWSWFGKGVILPIFEALVLMTFIHYALRQPVLKDSDKAEPQSKQVRAATLEQSQMQQIAEKLTAVMAKDMLYMQDDLSLKRLSETVSVTENHISETLSQFLHTNFFQFVNNYRVEQAKALLVSTGKNVSSIAYEVGFNSKSTFNSAFKKSSGITPTAYRNQQKMPVSEKIMH